MWSRDQWQLTVLGGREEKPESGAVARLRLSRWSGELLLDPILTEKNISIISMERLYMEAQDGLKTIAPPLFLNIFFYFLLV